MTFQPAAYHLRLFFTNSDIGHINHSLSITFCVSLIIIQTTVCQNESN